MNQKNTLGINSCFMDLDDPLELFKSWMAEAEKKEIKAEGMLSTCIQHEMDHLEGILFIDYLSKLKKTMIIKKLSKEKKVLERIVV